MDKLDKWYSQYQKWLNDRPQLPKFDGKYLQVEPVLFVEGGADFLIKIKKPTDKKDDFEEMHMVYKMEDMKKFMSEFEEYVKVIKKTINTEKKVISK